MLKKLLFFVLIGGFLTSVGPDKPRAETIIYGGAQIIVPGGDKTHGVGGGTMVGIGQKLDDKLIGWTHFESFKTEEGDEQDNVYIGFSLLSGQLIDPLRSGVFLTLEGGLKNVPDQKVQFGNLTNIGFYSELSPTTTFWLGGGYSGEVYSIDAGFTMTLDWK